MLIRISRRIMITMIANSYVFSEIVIAIQTTIVSKWFIKLRFPKMHESAREPDRAVYEYP